MGTHTIPTIGSGAKANSAPINGGLSMALLEFGTPDGNPGGGWGGSVTIEGPNTARLVAIARVYAIDSGTSNVIAEDYNAVQVP